jgi:hypothetical protein
MRGQEGSAIQGQEGDTTRGDTTTSQCNEKPRRQRSNRMTRGGATTSWGNKMTRRGRNKRMLRATTSCRNETMRGQRNKRQRNNQPAQQKDERAAWRLGVTQRWDVPFGECKGAGSKPAEEGPFPLFLGCNLASPKPAMMGVEEGGAAALAGRGLTTSLMHHGIEAGRGGLDTALPWVQFDTAQARDDRGGDPNIFEQIIACGW